MEPLIHYIHGGRGFGPVSVRDFLDLIERGVVALDDLVRIEGDGRWTRAGRIAEQLRQGRLSLPPAALTKPPSAIPPGSHTVFTTAPPIPKAPVPRELRAAAPCTHCGAEANLGALFCKRCGARLAPRPCASCRRDNDADALFCAYCGTRLAQPSGS